MATKKSGAVTKAVEAAAKVESEETSIQEVPRADTRLATFGGLMDDTPVDVRDFLIPKLILMQASSDAVKEEHARAGEIRGSVDLNKITEKDGSVEIIPFQVFKTWVTVKKKGNEYVGQIPLTAENVTKPREEVVNGEELINYETLNYYCLLPSEIASGMFMPYVVSFRSTSYMAGKTLETHRARLQEFKKPLCFKTFTLGCKQRENEHGKFYVYTIAESRDTTDAELDAVKHWHAIVKGGRAKVDESEMAARDGEAKASPAGGSVRQGDEF